jgi:hypothetical protein
MNTAAVKSLSVGTPVVHTRSGKVGTFVRTQTEQVCPGRYTTNAVMLIDGREAQVSVRNLKLA